MPTRTLLFRGDLATKMLPPSCSAHGISLDAVEDAVTAICDLALETHGRTRDEPSGEQQLTSLQYTGISDALHTQFCPVCS